MGRLISAANFIHSNMPNGTTDQPALSVEEAWDVAAYVESMNRPQKAGLDKDFPVRSEKSADAGYGPYAMTSAKASTSSAPSNRSATNSAR